MQARLIVLNVSRPKAELKGLMAVQVTDPSVSGLDYWTAQAPMVEAGMAPLTDRLFMYTVIVSNVKVSLFHSLPLG